MKKNDRMANRDRSSFTITPSLDYYGWIMPKYANGSNAFVIDRSVLGMYKRY